MKTALITIVIILALLGEILCTVKIFTSKKMGNRVLYGIAAATGLGCVVGYMDLEK